MMRAREFLNRLSIFKSTGTPGSAPTEQKAALPPVKKIIFLGNDTLKDKLFGFIEGDNNPFAALVNIGIAFFTYRAKDVTFEVWDTQSTERYAALDVMFLREASAAIVCVDNKKDLTTYLGRARKAEPPVPIIIATENVDVLAICKTQGLQVISSKVPEKYTNDDRETFMMEISNLASLQQAQPENKLRSSAPMAKR